MSTLSEGVNVLRVATMMSAFFWTLATIFGLLVSAVGVFVFLTRHVARTDRATTSSMSDDFRP